MSKTLIKIIQKEYAVRGKKWPTAQEAILWATTELGEAIDLLLMQNTTWVRNHPDAKELFTAERFSEELGDVICMLIVAAIVADAPNPLTSLRNKLTSKIREHGENKNESPNI